MKNAPIDHSPQTAVRLAGITYLLTMATANFADFYVRRQLFTHDDPVQTVKNIVSSGSLVRVGIGSDLITIAVSTILAVALYVILKPFSKNWALVALLWWLLECSVAALVTVNSLAALFFLRGMDSMQALNSDQLELVARLFGSADHAGDRIASVLFGLGSILFCCLWFKSRHIPRVLAAWGMRLTPLFGQKMGLFKVVAAA